MVGSGASCPNSSRTISPTPVEAKCLAPFSTASSTAKLRIDAHPVGNRGGVTGSVHQLPGRVEPDGPGHLEHREPAILLLEVDHRSPGAGPLDDRIGNKFGRGPGRETESSPTASWTNASARSTRDLFGWARTDRGDDGWRTGKRIRPVLKGSSGRGQCGCGARAARPAGRIRVSSSRASLHGLLLCCQGRGTKRT